MALPPRAGERLHEPGRGGHRPLRRNPSGDGHLTAARASLRHGLDKIVALFLLLIALPAFVAVALTLRVRGQGPVLATQTRIGVWGRTFAMLTFDGPWPATPSVAQAPASSGPAGGSVLRRALGRLPQLINVLRGDMGLVGPRPPRPEELARALRVRPGLVTLRRSRAKATRKATHGAVATNH